uniref:SH2 domain-containing protein n=1 Tax=Strigamia maritima TaxID=126957 RepID=T1IP51_STRMM
MMIVFVLWRNRSKSSKIDHYIITPRNDLYYINGFPFPYMEAIVFYYQKHRFNGTLLTQQAFIEPYLLAHKRSSRSPTLNKAQTFNRKDKRRQNRRGGTQGNYNKFQTL